MAMFSCFNRCLLLSISFGSHYYKYYVRNSLNGANILHLFPHIERGIDGFTGRNRIEERKGRGGKTIFTFDSDSGFGPATKNTRSIITIKGSFLMLCQGTFSCNLPILPIIVIINSIQLDKWNNLSNSIIWMNLNWLSSIMRSFTSLHSEWEV